MDREKIDELANEYKDELDALDEIRAENAVRYEGLSEEDFIKQLAEDYESVYRDAMERGVIIDIVSPDDEDEQ